MELISRREIIEKATIDCLDEMYRRSQPSITWDEVIEQSRQNKDRHIWREHYLPQYLYMRILEKYMHAYRIRDEWEDNIRVVEEYLEKGGTKDKYISAYTDSSGYHPGHRGYEKVKPIKEQIENILNNEFTSGEVSPFVKDGIRDKIIEVVMNTISDCKEFYKFDREEMGFRMDISNYSPNSNMESVREFYKDTDIVINEIPEEEEEDD